MRKEVAGILSVGRERLKQHPRDTAAPILVSKKAYVAFGRYLHQQQRVRRMAWTDCRDTFDKQAWHDLKNMMRHSHLMAECVRLEITA